MRPSPKHRLIGFAIALSLGAAVALALSGLASASLLGKVVPPVTVELGPLNVEAGPSTKVEVPGVATVQAPSASQSQSPVPPVTVSTPVAPPVTTPALPTASTPVVTTPGAPVSSGGSGSGASGTGTSSSGASGASTVATATSAAAGGGSGAASPAASTQAAAGAERLASPSARARQAARRRTAGNRKAQAAAAQAAGRQAPGASTATAAGASSAKPAPSSVHKAARKAASSNPLDSIGRQIPFPVPVPDWSKPIILLLLLLAIFFAARSRLSALRARRLERQRAVLLGDLDSMQAALVPEIPRRLGDLSVSVAYRPADGPAAGGDFYDLFVLEPGRVAIVLGDVAGHGRGALTQAALTRYTLRAYMQAGLEPRAALSLAGSVLSEPGELQFATVLAAVYDSANGRLTYASAGHDPPIAIGFEVPEPPTVCCSAPVGCNLPTGRRQTTISVPPGGKVCFFSDGLLEARTPGGLLGRERLVELVGELGPSDSAPALLERVRDDALRTPDDMMACIVSSAVGAPAPKGHVEELEVDEQALAGTHVSAFLRACAVDAADLVPLLLRAHELVGDGRTALLRIERSGGGEVGVAALPGLSTAAAKAAIVRDVERRALAPALGRATA
jgi:Stage II sporulation protein E (SpoIIE)